MECITIVSRHAEVIELCRQVAEAEGLRWRVVGPHDSQALDLEPCAAALVELADSSLATLASITCSFPTVPVVVLVESEHDDATVHQFIAQGAIGVAELSESAIARELQRVSLVAQRLKAFQSHREEFLEEARQAEKLRALGLLAAGVGHEINNPAAIISANLVAMDEDLQRFAGLVSDDLPEKVPLFDELESELMEMRSAIDRIATIAHDLRVFSRHEDGSNLPWVDINHAVRNVVSLVKKQIAVKGAEVSLFLAPDLPPLRLSANRLYQVITNLLINALHAVEGKSGGGQISITTTADENAVAIIVTDDGIGIPADEVRNIFEPFYSTKLEKGTGLGLHVARNLVVQMGGDIFVESRAGQGATFIISLERTTLQETTAAEAGVVDGPERRLGVDRRSGFDRRKKC